MPKMLGAGSQMLKAGLFLGLFFSLFKPMASHAMDSTELLPAKVNSPAFRYGMISGIDSKYTADGSVRSLSDINTIEFNSSLLQTLDPRIKTFVDTLNTFSNNNLGTQLNLGTLRIDTEPRVNYLAPIYARGITNNFTMAVAAPIVYYKNKMQLQQSSSNVSEICGHVTGVSDPLLVDACNQLSKKLTDVVQDQLVSRGYRRIEDRDETIFSDMQLVGLYKFYEKEEITSVARTTLTLPTGPSDDPDDLADISVFGRKAVEEQVLLNYKPIRWLRLATKASYKLAIPDSVVMRVPTTEGDVLPGPETKEKVSRNIGDTITWGAAANIAITSAFEIAGGYEYSVKGEDKYSGTRGGSYSTLAKDSRSTSHKLRAGFSFDTIALYTKTKSFPPLKFDYEISNTFAGINSDRQMVNEFSFTMFF